MLKNDDKPKRTTSGKLSKYLEDEDDDRRLLADLKSVEDEDSELNEEE